VLPNFFVKRQVAVMRLLPTGGLTFQETTCNFWAAAPFYRRFQGRGWTAFVLHGFEKSTKRRLPRLDFVMMHL
jgi:hypothetical protein